MKIYFIGCHSSGKSTLTRYVAEKYKLPMIPEVARAVLAEKELNVDILRSNMDIVDDYQSEVFYRQISEEQKYEDFVADRSAIDCLAYSSQHARIASKLFADPILDPYIENIHKSILFFVRPSKATLKSDGVREAINWDNIIAIDAQIKLMLQMWNIKHIQISTDSMQERVTLIDTVLSLI